MSDNLFPPDLERLQVLRIFLSLALDAVDARIERVQELQRRRGHAFRLQHLSPADGGNGHGVLHDDTCSITGGGRLDRDEAMLALKEPSIELCATCQPDPRPPRAGYRSG